jgi:hypothetical protein
MLRSELRAMTARETQTACRLAGVTLTVAGPQLKARPGSLLTPELHAAITANKPELLRLLSVDQDISPPPQTVCPTCGFGVWSHPLAGRPPRCMRCGAVDPTSGLCLHVHLRREGSWWVCSDCEIQREPVVVKKQRVQRADNPRGRRVA